MTTVVKSFKELTVDELYTILALRSEVFVVEQCCAYQDVDGSDSLALHVMLMEERKLIAYARLFNAGVLFNEASIGRVVVAPEARKRSLGHVLMKTAIAEIEKRWFSPEIKIAAQEHLKDFYRQHGFAVCSESFLEDGIPHVYMVRT